MITAMLVGAALGASLFFLLLRVAAPLPAPVVELALLDARHAGSGDSGVESVAVGQLAGGWDALAGRIGE